MRFWEAMKALDEGKMIRRKHFDDMEPHRFKGLVDLLTNCCEDEIRSFLSAGWDVYEEPKPKLTFAEMLKGLKKGKSFVRKDGRFSISNDSLLKAIGYDAGDFEATDWEEVT